MRRVGRTSASNTTCIEMKDAHKYLRISGMEILECSLKVMQGHHGRKSGMVGVVQPTTHWRPHHCIVSMCILYSVTLHSQKCPASDKAAWACNWKCWWRH